MQGCFIILGWIIATFILPLVFFNTGFEINEDLGNLDLVLSILIGIIGFAVLRLIWFLEKEDKSKWPKFTISAIIMLVIYSIIANLIIGFGDIGQYPSQQLARKIIIYFVYLIFSIIYDVLASNGKMETITL